MSMALQWGRSDFLRINRSVCISQHCSDNASMGPQRFPADQRTSDRRTLTVYIGFNGAAAISCGSTTCDSEFLGESCRLQWGRSDFLRINVARFAESHKRWGLQWGRSDFLRINGESGFHVPPPSESLQWGRSDFLRINIYVPNDVWLRWGLQWGRSDFLRINWYEAVTAAGLDGASMGPQRFPADQPALAVAIVSKLLKLQWGRSDFLRINIEKAEVIISATFWLQWGRSDFLRINRGRIGQTLRWSGASMGPQRFPADQHSQVGDNQHLGWASMGPQRFPADQLRFG